MVGADIAQVVIAAGGLGTRVAGWSRLVPKEFSAHRGSPGMVHLLREISPLAPARVAIVYHPYYETFYSWVQEVLTPGGISQYDLAAGRPTDDPPVIDGLDLTFLRQQGEYADVTSVLNGASILNTGPLYVIFADNLYPGFPLQRDFGQTRAPSVLARAFALEEAHRRGVIICSPDGQQMLGLVEKPSKRQAQTLMAQYGEDNLRLLEGRAMLTPQFISHLRAATFIVRRGEPKLALALADYVQEGNPVHVVTTSSDVIDLGAPEALRAPVPAIS